MDTLLNGPNVLPSVVYVSLSLKSGSVATHDIIGLFQNEANSAAGRAAEKKMAS